MQQQPERSHDSVSDTNEDYEGKAMMGTNETNQDREVGLSREEEEDVWESLGIVEEINASSSSSSTSLISNSNVTLDQESNFCWDTIDSLPLWEAMYYLDDELSFMYWP